MSHVSQDRVIFHRLENICHCVERGEWPGGHRYGASLLSAMDSHSSTPVPGTPTSTPLPVDSASSAASALERLVSNSSCSSSSSSSSSSNRYKTLFDKGFSLNFINSNVTNYVSCSVCW